MTKMCSMLGKAVGASYDGNHLPWFSCIVFPEIEFLSTLLRKLRFSNTHSCISYFHIQYVHILIYSDVLVKKFFFFGTPCCR